MKLNSSHLEAAYRLGLDAGSAIGFKNGEAHVHRLRGEIENASHCKETALYLEMEFEKKRWWRLPGRSDFRAWRMKLEKKAEDNYLTNWTRKRSVL